MRIKQYQASIERLEARWTCSLIPRQHLQVILKTSEATNAHSLSESVAPGSLSTPASESIDFLLELDEYEEQEKYPDTPFLDPEEAITYDLISDEDDAGDREHDEATRHHEAFVKRTEPSRQRNEADAKDARWSKQSHKPPVEAATEPSRQRNEASSEGWLKPHPEAPVEASESLQADLEDGSRIEWNLPVSHQLSYLCCVWPTYLGENVRRIGDAIPSPAHTLHARREVDRRCRCFAHHRPARYVWRVH